MAQIIEFGRVVRPALGIGLAPPQLTRQLGLEGVLVLEVPPGSAAGKAGLMGTYRDLESGGLVLGDCITGLDGRPVRSIMDLYDQLDEKRVGDKVQLQVLSRGQFKRTLDVVLGERVVGGEE